RFKPGPPGHDHPRRLTPWKSAVVRTHSPSGEVSERPMSVIPRSLRTACAALVVSVLAMSMPAAGPLGSGPASAQGQAQAQTVAPAAAEAAAQAVAARSDLIGQFGMYVTKHEDTLVGIAVDLGIGYTELLLANPGIDPWLPGEGTSLLLPTQHVLPH